MILLPFKGPEKMKLIEIMNLSTAALKEAAQENVAAFLISQLGPKLEAALKADSSARSKGVNDVNGLIDFLNDKIDPTAKKFFVKPLAQFYVRKFFKLEDELKFFEALKIFEKHKAKMPIKDLAQYTDLNQFWAAIEPFEGIKTGAETKREIKDKEVTVYMDTPELKVIIPKTFEASCVYGSNTKWCTTEAPGTHFKTYSQQGPLYILIFKNLNRKFQYHYESGQFKNEKDVDVSKSEIEMMSKVPGYTEFLNRQIKLHYSKFLDDSE